MPSIPAPEDTLTITPYFLSIIPGRAALEAAMCDSKLVLTIVSQTPKSRFLNLSRIDIPPLFITMSTFSSENNVVSLSSTSLGLLRSS